MLTELISVMGPGPWPEAISRAAEALRRGELVAFPTETVYGLGAVALNESAVHRIFEAKGRPAYNPLIVHIASFEGALQLVADWPQSAVRLAKRFWPGPLTLVLPKSDLIPTIVTGGGSTVALRMPAHPVALELLRSVGGPLAAPSANRSSQLSPTQAEHVLRDLDGRIAMVLDGGPTQGGLESTVLDLTTDPPRVLRPGLIRPTEIEREIGKIDWSVSPGSPEAGPLPSPGMLPRHYAPRTPTECHSEEEAWSRVQSLCARGIPVGWLTFNIPETPTVTGLTPVIMPSQPDAYASRLYATLHTLDQSGVSRIVVSLPPKGEGWLAIHNRLRRAAM